MYIFVRVYVYAFFVCIVTGKTAIVGRGPIGCAGETTVSVTVICNGNRMKQWLLLALDDERYSAFITRAVLFCELWRTRAQYRATAQKIG